MAQHPIVLLELLDLTQLGINPEAIKFGSTTMESDKFIVTCETIGEQQNVVMVDLAAGNQVTRRPISAEAAIMNPVSKVRPRPRPRPRDRGAGREGRTIRPLEDRERRRGGGEGRAAG
jgi:hypothetical protein